MRNKGEDELSGFSYPRKNSVAICSTQGIHKRSEKETNMEPRKQLG